MTASTSPWKQSATSLKGIIVWYHVFFRKSYVIFRCQNLPYAIFFTGQLWFAEDDSDLLSLKSEALSRAFLYELQNWVTNTPTSSWTMNIHVCLLPKIPGDELKKMLEKKVRKAIMKNNNFIKYYTESIILWIK